MKTARALWFDGCPVIVTDDWRKVKLNIPWTTAVDLWETTKHTAEVAVRVRGSHEA